MFLWFVLPSVAKGCATLKEYFLGHLVRDLADKSTAIKHPTYSSCCSDTKYLPGLCKRMLLDWDGREPYSKSLKSLDATARAVRQINSFLKMTYVREPLCNLELI